MLAGTDGVKDREGKNYMKEIVYTPSISYAVMHPDWVTNLFRIRSDNDVHSLISMMGHASTWYLPARAAASSSTGTESSRSRSF